MSARGRALGAFTVLAGVASVGGFFSLRHASRHAQLVDVVLDPSHQRLWTVHSNEDDHGFRGGQATVECIDRGTGDRLWSTSMQAHSAGPSMFGARGSLLTDNRLLFATSPSASTTGLVALDADTGGQLWSARADGTPWAFGTLHVVADVAVLMTAGPQLSDPVLTAVSLDDGTLRWVADSLPRVVAPRRVSDSLVFASERGVHRVHARSGDQLDLLLERVGPGHTILPVFDVGEDRVATFEGGRWLEAGLDDTTWTVTNKVPTPDGSSWSTFELPECAVGLREGTLVLLLEDGMHRYGADGALSWSLPFPDGFGAHPFCRRYTDPSSDVTAQYPTRYTPLVLTRRIAPGRVEQQLVIVDLEQGSLAWRATKIEQEGGTWTNSMLFRRGDFYGIPLVRPFREGERWFFFGLDGQTGKFTIAVDLQGRGSSAQLSLDPPHRPWLVDRDSILGYGQDVAELWGLDRSSGAVLSGISTSSQPPTNDLTLVEEQLGSPPP